MDVYFDAGWARFRSTHALNDPITVRLQAELTYEMARAAFRCEWAAARAGLYPPAPTGTDQATHGCVVPFCDEYGQQVVAGHLHHGGPF